MRNQAREVVMIGHKGHPEVEGTMGQSRDGMYLVETPEDVRSLKVGTPAGTEEGVSFPLPKGLV